MNWQTFLASIPSTAGVTAVVAAVGVVLAGAVSFAAATLGAVVAAFAARRSSERAIQIENITKERAKWRDKIREKALEVHKAAAAGQQPERLQDLYLEMSLNLNPSDPEDRGILDVVHRLSNGSATQELRIEFGNRIALLLKHDWKRAKREAKLPWIMRWSPRRMTYEEFKNLK